MKLTNSTDFADHFLRRMASWCCRQLGFPPSKLRAARFGNSRNAWGGLAYLGSYRIGVRVGSASRFPCKSHKHRLIGQQVIADRIEALVEVTAHEIAHLDQYRERSRTRIGGGAGGSEARTDRRSWDVLESFRQQRDALLSEWSAEPKPRATRAVVSLTEKREAKVLADLKRWERKLKLAKTKVTNLKRKARYYEKRHATAAIQPPSNQ